ncbi:hypothetical protein [Endozoicomonas sp.]|uniref:hypothetical protein n=1 Tax=Endozoicomonas sp. TaxID=1892382 RepID=UPI0028845D2E|nr:hypothetical protein [Endozoicomonas sp.]
MLKNPIQSTITQSDQQYFDVLQIKANLEDDFKNGETRNFTCYLVKTKYLKGLKPSITKTLRDKTVDNFDVLFGKLQQLGKEHRIKILKNFTNFLGENINATSKPGIADEKPSESLRNLRSIFIDDKTEYNGDLFNKLLAVDPFGDDIYYKSLKDIYQKVINEKKCRYFNGLEGKFDEILVLLAKTEFFSSITREPIYLTVKLNLSETAKKTFNIEYSEFKRSIYIKPDNRSLMEYDKNVHIIDGKHKSLLLSKNTTGNLDPGTLNLILELDLDEKTEINDDLSFTTFAIRYNSLKDGYNELDPAMLKLAKEKLGFYADKVNIYDKGIPSSQMTEFKNSLERIILTYQSDLISIMTKQFNPLEESRKNEGNTSRHPFSMEMYVDGVPSNKGIKAFHQKMNDSSIFTDDELKKMKNEVYEKFGEGEERMDIYE